MSTLKVDTIANTAGVTTNRILQVKHVRDEAIGSQSVTTSAPVALSNLSIDITPSSSSSLFLLQAQWSGELSVTSAPYNSGFYFDRSGTALRPSGVGNRGSFLAPTLATYDLQAANTMDTAFITYLDAPSTTSQITYKVYFDSVYVNCTLYTNRVVTDSDASTSERTFSTFIVMEIAG